MLPHVIYHVIVLQLLPVRSEPVIDIAHSNLVKDQDSDTTLSREGHPTSPSPPADTVSTTISPPPPCSPPPGHQSSSVPSPPLQASSPPARTPTPTTSEARAGHSPAGGGNIPSRSPLPPIHPPLENIAAAAASPEPSGDTVLGVRASEDISNIEASKALQNEPEPMARSKGSTSHSTHMPDSGPSHMATVSMSVSRPHGTPTKATPPRAASASGTRPPVTPDHQSQDNSRSREDGVCSGTRTPDHRSQDNSRSREDGVCSGTQWHTDTWPPVTRQLQKQGRWGLQWHTDTWPPITRQLQKQGRWGLQGEDRTLRRWGWVWDDQTERWQRSRS